MDSEDRILRRLVGAEHAGIRLDVFLAGLPEVARRSSAKALIHAGRVLVDGRLKKAGAMLAAGQEVQLRPVVESAPASAPDPAADWPFELRVLFDDPHLLVIDKAPGLTAHRPENPRHVVPNVADLAVAHFGPLPTIGGEDRPGIVHRLDRETSGVMVLAKTDEAYHFLKSQFRSRTVRKEYRAICYGEPRFDSDYIERNIAPHPQKGDRMTVVTSGGKDAATFYQIVERFSGFAHVCCKPRTGRTHQIRVHLTSIGHSLVGDRQYRSRNAQHAELPREAPAPGRHCLHAHRLVIRHPRTHEEIGFDAPLPSDMESLLAWLRVHRAR